MRLLDFNKNAPAQSSAVITVAGIEGVGAVDVAVWANGQKATYTIPVGNTAAQTASGLQAKIDALSGITATVSDAVISIVSDDGSPLPVLAITDSLTQTFSVEDYGSRTAGNYDITSGTFPNAPVGSADGEATGVDAKVGWTARLKNPTGGNATLWFSIYVQDPYTLSWRKETTVGSMSLIAGTMDYAVTSGSMDATGVSGVAIVFESLTADATVDTWLWGEK